ncbi:hypothetical protein [Aeromonas salmonicida]|uniref:hypothetical protein n=1 Tax=Aeromonas salmonicida TaxID=645 RepID=UPI001B4F6A97|nr:hypothetical protein [Aeromonadaceae bacterium]
MQTPLIAIELEAYHDPGGQIEVVRDHGLRVDGYALYLRYLTERGDALAEWLCDHPDRHWLSQVGNLLATSYAIPLHDYTSEARVA